MLWSVLEGGVLIASSDATARGLWVRDVTPSNEVSVAGAGVVAQDGDDGVASLSLSGSVVERVHYIGVFAIGSHLEAERVLIRDVEAQLMTGQFGRGLAVQSNQESGAPADAFVRGCAVERTVESALFVGGATVTFDGVRVSDVEVGPSGFAIGRGLTSQPNTGVPSYVSMQWSHIDGAMESAIFATGGRSR